MTNATYEISSFGTARVFIKEGTCSETLMNVLDRAYGYPLEVEEHAVAPLAGGISGQGFQCGMLWGACLAAGAEAYRRFGGGLKGEAAAIFAAKKLVEAFRARETDINCLEITDTDWNKKWQIAKYFLKGGTIGCMRRVMGFAEDAFNVINTALLEAPLQVPAGPVSCASMLARQMGASPMHVVMAAGLAGGIGFSGGACGALGAAIWLNAMNSKKPTGFSLMTKGAADLINRFLELTDYEFECANIVGEKFENIGAHAYHVRSGGCNTILKELAVPYRHEQAA